MPSDLAEAVLVWDELDRRAASMHVTNQYPSGDFIRQRESARREMVRLAKQAANDPRCSKCRGEA